MNNLKIELEDVHQKCLHTEVNFGNQCEKLKEELILKEKELEDTNNQLTEMMNNSFNVEANAERDVQEQKQEIIRLSEIIYDLNKYKEDNESARTVLETEMDKTKTELSEAVKKIVSLEHEITQKTSAVHRLEQELENLTMINEDNVVLQSKITELNRKIHELKSKLDNSESTIETQKTETENKLKEKVTEITILNDKLKNIVECKDEIIGNLKNMIGEKDEQVIALNVEVTKLSENVLRLDEELKETHAELDICKNEFITLKEEHDVIVNRNDNNLVLKNQDIRDLHSEINKLKEELITEREKLNNELNSEKQVGYLFLYCVVL